MRKERIYISTIAQDCASVAEQLGFGLEIAEFCTAYNMDDRFPETDKQVREELRGIPNRLFHAPFNELFPCAVDPKARELARFRYRQAIALAQSYGADKVIIHGGYHPWIFYPCWYTEQSILFWREFMKEVPGDMTVCLENVLEDKPEMLLEIVRETAHPRLKLCLDVGHVNAYAKQPPEAWLEVWAPFLSHFHIHNNDGTGDSHSQLDRGSVPMEAFLRLADRQCPDATFTIEVPQAEPSARWLLERGLVD